MTTIQSAENRGKMRHRFWLRLRHAVILISNDQTSASKKINGMMLIRTLTVSTTAFERTKEKFYGFRQTELHNKESDEKISLMSFLFSPKQAGGGGQILPPPGFPK